MSHLKPLSSDSCPLALVPAVELVTLHVVLPVQLTVTDDPNKLSVHVTPPPLPKLTVPDVDLPSAAMVSVKSALGHLTLKPVVSSVRAASVAVPLMTALTGVRDAAAGGAATARATSSATSNRVAVLTFMRTPFLQGYVGLFINAPHKDGFPKARPQ
jgi:hypothetical protein